MKEYKVLTANDLKHAEQVMNDMAQAGWQVVGTTIWNSMFQYQFVITLEREI
ncbi:MAG: DUF4177 domain-containing protein [Lawsonibacter sp.]|jgi:hypothetical protein